MPLRRIVGLAALLTVTLNGACASGRETASAPVADEPKAKAHAKVQLRLTALSNDGQPLALAKVRIRASGKKEELAEVELEQGRALQLELPGSGIYFAHLDGENHRFEWWPFRVVGDGPVMLSGRLGTLKRAQPQGPLKVRARWIDGAGEPQAEETLEATGEGDSWRFSVEPPAGARALQYQLVGVFEDNRNATPPFRDRLACENDECWGELDASRLASPVEVDLALLPKSDQPSRWQVEGAERLDVTASRAWVEPYESRIFEAMMELGKHPSGENGEADPSPERDEIIKEMQRGFAQMRAAVEATQEPELRQLRALRYFGVAGQLFEPAELGSEPLLWALDQLEPDDWRWCSFVSITNVAYRAWTMPEVRKRFEEILRVSPDPGVRASLLHVQLIHAEEAGDEALARETYAILERDYPESWSFTYARETHDPNRPLQVGRVMPRWEFARVDGEQGTLRSEELAGKPYLLDVWATWCGPCVGEMEHLHEAYARIHGMDAKELPKLGQVAEPRIEFIALSFDDEVEPVHAFRKDQWSMPWTNLILEDDEAQQALFESWVFWGIPKLVLVGADGKILATEKQLRGEELLPTLERVLGG